MDSIIEVYLEELGEGLWTVGIFAGQYNVTHRCKHTWTSRVDAIAYGFKFAEDFGLPFVDETATRLIRNPNYSAMTTGRQIQEPPPFVWHSPDFIVYKGRYYAMELCTAAPSERWFKVGRATLYVVPAHILPPFGIIYKVFNKDRQEKGEFNDHNGCLRPLEDMDMSVAGEAQPLHPGGNS